MKQSEGEAANEISFLKDNVNRLNTICSNYQSEFGSLADYSQKERKSFKIPEKKHFQPILLEYDRLFDKQSKVISDQNAMIDDYKLRMSQLSAENDKMRQERKQQNGGRDTEVSANQTATAKLDLARIIEENLSGQLEEVKQEKQLSEQIRQKLEMELDTLNRQLQQKEAELARPPAEQLRNQANHLQTQFNDCQNQYAEEVDRWRARNEELEKLTVGREVDSKHADKELQIMAERLRIEQKSRADATVQLQAGLAQLDSVERDRKRLLDELAELRASQSTAANDRAGVLDKVGELRDQLAERNREAFEARQDAAEVRRQLDSVTSAQTQLELAAQQSREETERMRSSMNRLIEEAGESVRREAEEARARVERQLAELRGELERERTEHAAAVEQMARVQRQLDRGQLEAESGEASHQHALTGAHRERELAEDRALRAERESAETRLQLEAVRTGAEQQRREASAALAEKDEELARSERRAGELERVCERRGVESASDSEQRRRAQLELAAAHKQLSDARKSANHKLALCQQRHAIQLAQLENSVAAEKELAAANQAQLHALLDAQQKLTQKWKDETAKLTDRFEARASQMRANLSRTNARNEELTSQLAHTRLELTNKEEIGATQRQRLDQLETKLKLLIEKRRAATPSHTTTAASSQSMTHAAKKTKQHHDVRQEDDAEFSYMNGGGDYVNSFAGAAKEQKSMKVM